MAYIDKAKAIEKLTAYKENHLSFPKACLGMIDTCITLIKIIPTADVEEVVRCGECRHGEKTSNFRTDCTTKCGLHNKTMFDIDFCSYGERKDAQ